MKRTPKWRAVYIAFILLAALLILVGQWGAGVTTLVMTTALSQLVRIGNYLHILTAALNESGEADHPATQDHIASGSVG